MKKKEHEIVEVLIDYFRAKNALHDARQALNLTSLGEETVFLLAKLVAKEYNCHAITTRTGSISFCESLSDPRATRRDDARKFWQRNILGNSN